MIKISSNKKPKDLLFYCFLATLILTAIIWTKSNQLTVTSAFLLTISLSEKRFFFTALPNRAYIQPRICSPNLRVRALWRHNNAKWHLAHSICISKSGQKNKDGEGAVLVQRKAKGTGRLDCRTLEAMNLYRIKHIDAYTMQYASTYSLRSKL